MNKTNLNIKREEDKVIISITNLGVFSKKNDFEGYTVFCPSLKVIGFGKTKKAAHIDFNRKLEIFFGIHVSNDAIDDVLLKFNWNRNAISVLKPIEEQPLYGVDAVPHTDPVDVVLSIAA